MAFHPPWFNPQMPDREHCVLSELLLSAAAETPNRTFALFDNGEQWTYADLLAKVCERAAALQQLGLAKGDKLLVWLPNGPELVLSWFAANWLGACFVPVNPAYRGALLAHVIENSQARLMVVHGTLVKQLAKVDLAQLQQIIYVGSCADVNDLDSLKGTDSQGIEFAASELESIESRGVTLSSVEVLQSGDLQSENSLSSPPDQPMPWDLQSIIYTSGTTGPSKGVLSSYFHLYTAATVIFGHISGDDRIFVNGPMFHLGGTCSLYAALIYRASVVVVDGFKTSEFWRQIADTGATVTSGLLGSMAPLLASNSSPQDRDNPLRITHFYPVSEVTIDLAETFGFDYFSGFGMTELPLPLVTDLNTKIHNSCGRPRSGVEVRLVDEHDCEVAQGEVGELIARTDHTWSLMSGYHGMPEAKVRLGVSAAALSSNSLSTQCSLSGICGLNQGG